MTRASRDYSKGKIYKLECLNTGKLYVGHTTKQYLSQRLQSHLSQMKQWRKGKHHYCTSFKILEGGNYQITLIESYPCKSEDELKARERYWIETTRNRVNKTVPTRTAKEWAIENHDRIRQQRKEYYQANKEAICERVNAYRMANQEQIREKKKEYHIANQDRICEKTRSYYQANRDQINEQRREKTTCECGSVVSVSNLTRHTLTKKHQDYIASLKV